MHEGFLQAAYMTAGVLFILSLGGLSNQESAKRAIWYGMAGMALAMLSTVLAPGIGNFPTIAAMILVGAAVGTVVGMRVEMTGMPQLVAALHSFVGLAAVFIGINAELALITMSSGSEDSGLTGFAIKLAAKSGPEIAILKVEVLLGIFIGAITFTGSVVAFGKLAGRIGSRPRKLPGGHFWNGLAFVGCVALGASYLGGGSLPEIVLVALLAGLIGWHLIMGIGGADMPVVVSMLNSYSGWAAAAIGFTLENDLLIITGALVGSSGGNPVVHHVPRHEPELRERHIGGIRWSRRSFGGR